MSALADCVPASGPLPRLVPRSLLAAAAAVLLGGLGAAPAKALPYLPVGDECSLVRLPLFAPFGQALVDSAGYTVSMGAGGNGGYATLWDGGLGSSPGDAWNGWGQLYVGTTPSNANAYVDASAHGCAKTSAGDEVDFAKVTLGGLQVQRSMLVPDQDGGGVRIVDAVTNPTSASVTTGVWVGDLLSGHGDGLGSDDGTVIRSTSSGDTALAPADLWAVTTDSRQNTSLDPSDPALAHVWGGPGATTPITVVRAGAQSGDKPIDNAAGTLAKKQLGWGWQQVTIKPGETARFLSWELPQQLASRSWVDQAPAAKAAAEALLAAPLATRYQGMSAAEIASVRNWAPPAVTGGIASIPGATTTADTTLRAVGIDYGAGEMDGCDSGTLSWDLGDGAQGTGSMVTHRFAAGTAHVTLSIDGACGGHVTRSLTFAVAAPSPEPTPTPAPPSQPTPPAPTPADERTGDDADDPATSGPTLRLFGPPSVKTSTLASSHGLVIGVQASVDGDVRMVLTGAGVKSVKSAAVKAGVTYFVKVQLDRSARPAALTLKSIKLRAKLTPDGGGEVIENLVLKLRR